MDGILGLDFILCHDSNHIVDLDTSKINSLSKLTIAFYKIIIISNHQYPIPMTPAMKLLKSHKVDFSVHEYNHDINAKSFGLEAAEKLGLNVEDVFKTLMVTDDKNYFVAILPVHHQLNLKKVSSALGCKKLHMADPKDAERLTGYLVGGISPLGQKKRLKTVLDASAQSKEKIYVSGGKRGLDIGLNPNDLSQLLNATFMDIVDK